MTGVDVQRTGTDRARVSDGRGLWPIATRVGAAVGLQIICGKAAARTFVSSSDSVGNVTHVARLTGPPADPPEVGVLERARQLQAVTEGAVHPDVRDQD